VGWLQQAACAANSLDVDVFASAAGRGQVAAEDGDDVGEDAGEAEEMEEEGEAEGGGDGEGPTATPAAAAAAAATPASPAAAAGGAPARRAPRARARAGLLAAPPRLLHRLVCLLRRALGAAYLLSVDLHGSGVALPALLQQVALAATALLDDVAAVDRCVCRDLFI